MSNYGTASHFADFVFSANNPDLANTDRVHSKERRDNLRLGRLAEQEINNYRELLYKLQGSWLKPSSWKVIYDGQSQSDGSRPDKIFSASCLRARQSPMICMPDLVFQCDSTGTILIVERKVQVRGRLFKPPCGSWPNVRAQLWCYAWIDDWLAVEDKSVFLLAEHFWSPPKAYGPQCLGVAGMWRRDNLDFNVEATRYFAAYEGTIDSPLRERSFIPEEENEER